MSSIEQKTHASIGLGDDLSKPLPPTHDEKGFIRFMPELIKEMNRRGASFTLDSTSGGITLEGFYKNGAMQILIEGDEIVALDRKGKKVPLKTFQDLVELNFNWWKKSLTKGIYFHPIRPWLDDFIKNGWVLRQVIYKPKDGGISPELSEES